MEFIDIYPTLCERAGITLPDHLEGKPEFMLYDLKLDPEENVNLAGEAAHQTVLESMEKMMDDLQKIENNEQH